MIEPHGALVDELAGTMGVDEEAFARLDGSIRLGKVKTLLEESYHWALQIDFAKPENQARFWYVSAEKLEPRIGDRFAGRVRRWNNLSASQEWLVSCMWRFVMCPET